MRKILIVILLAFGLEAQEGSSVCDAGFTGELQSVQVLDDLLGDGFSDPLAKVKQAYLNGVLFDPSGQLNNGTDSNSKAKSKAQYIIYPGKGVGSIRLGLKQEDVATLVDLQNQTMKDSLIYKKKLSHYDSDKNLSFYFDQGILVQIDVKSEKYKTLDDLFVTGQYKKHFKRCQIQLYYVHCYNGIRFATDKFTAKSHPITQISVVKAQ